MKNVHSSKNDPFYKSKKHCEDVMVRYGSLASEMSASTIDGDYSTPDCLDGFDISYATKKLVREVILRKTEPYLKETAEMQKTNSFQGNGTNESKINIWPSPFDIVVGTKFVNIFSGKLYIPGFRYTRSDSFSADFDF